MKSLYRCESYPYHAHEQSPRDQHNHHLNWPDHATGREFPNASVIFAFSWGIGYSSIAANVNNRKIAAIRLTPSAPKTGSRSPRSWTAGLTRRKEGSVKEYYRESHDRHQDKVAT